LMQKLKSAKNRPLQKALSPAESEIENVIFLHVAQVFSAHPPTRSQVGKGIKAWMRLRWRLWIANRLVRKLVF